MKHLLHVLLSLVLSVPCIQVYAQPGNDNFANATDITSLINSCTSGGAYTTLFATPDQSKASCWSNGPNNNVWFKFTATSTGFINTKVKVSGSGETMQNPFVAIYDASMNLLTCQNFMGAKVDLSLSYLGLTPGNTYYIVVDNYAGYAGSFDLCLSDVVDYDFMQGAVDVTSLINSCTSGGTYTTQFATPDQSRASCWSNGPNNNVWFKFTATATGFINAQVKVSGAGETMQNPFVAIYDASMNLLACQNFMGAKTDLSLSYLGLTPGSTYYIVVDNYAGYAGSFDLCLSDVVNYDFMQGAVDVTSLIDNSCTSGGLYTTQFATPDQSRPSCWSNGPNNNVWFKFTATSTGFINAQVKVSGSGETMPYPFVAIYDAGMNLIACQNYVGSHTDLSLSYLGLTPGSTYYIVVDNYAGYPGSFDLCLSDVVNNDFMQGAVDVTSLIDNSCTSGGLYTTQFATPDQSRPSCWSNGPNNNVWFKFTATSTGFINAQVKVSGAGETMPYPLVAIYDAGMNLISCQNYVGYHTDLSLSYLGLTPGNTYYIVVDNFASYPGSFDLCLSDVVNYDFEQGALDVTGQMNSTTSGGTYTTAYATPDQSGASCWSNGPNNNVWFKFTAATPDIAADVIVSGAGETMPYPFVAIYDASMNLLACQNYIGSHTDLSLTYTSLTPGDTYYIVVDNYATYPGSFDLGVYNNIVSLPLQLLSFNASPAQKQVNVYWSTAQEENIDLFTIQRSNSLPNFNDIGQINPTGGDSIQANYTFLDTDPSVGDDYYRLKIAGKTGGITYSKIVEVNYGGADSVSFTLFPNPNNGKGITWLKIENSKSLSAINVNLYDMLGRTICSQLANLSGMSPYLLQIPATQHLATGIYTVTVTVTRSGDLIYRQQLVIK